jgi:hypothetical protein
MRPHIITREGDKKADRREKEGGREILPSFHSSLCWKTNFYSFLLS